MKKTTRRLHSKTILKYTNLSYYKKPMPHKNKSQRIQLGGIVIQKKIDIDNPKVIEQFQKNDFGNWWSRFNWI